MNKRQKKKNINNALKHLKNAEMTKQDMHILKTYGREEFVKNYKVNPEVLYLDFKKFFDKFTKAISALGYAFGETLENIGSELKRAFRKNKDVDEAN